jgi:hypothetical protein
VGASFPLQQGVAYSFFHPVRTMDGVYVAGQAANLGKALLGPDRLAATAGELAAVTLADYATGWVLVTATEPRLGEYTLTLTNPEFPTADGRAEDYSLKVTAGLVPSPTLLTTRDRVRARLQLKNANGQPITPGDAHPLDGLIDLVISEVSDEYQNWLGRTFIETAYTEYMDGSGTPHLVLPAGPLASFTSLSTVDYQDNGAGGVNEVLTTVPRHTYVLAGWRTQPRFLGRGRVDLVGGHPFMPCFARGRRNFKAVFSAGFAAVPEGIVGLATEDVAFRVLSGEHGDLLSKSLGDGSISFMRPQQMVELRDERLRPYLLEAA